MWAGVPEPPAKEEGGDNKQQKFGGSKVEIQPELTKKKEQSEKEEEPFFYFMNHPLPPPPEEVAAKGKQEEKSEGGPDTKRRERTEILQLNLKSDRSESVSSDEKAPRVPEESPVSRLMSEPVERLALDIGEDVLNEGAPPSNHQVMQQTNVSMAGESGREGRTEGESEEERETGQGESEGGPQGEAEEVKEGEGEGREQRCLEQNEEGDGRVREGGANKENLEKEQDQENEREKKPSETEGGTSEKTELTDPEQVTQDEQNTEAVREVETSEVNRVTGTSPVENSVGSKEDDTVKVVEDGSSGGSDGRADTSDLSAGDLPASGSTSGVGASVVEEVTIAERVTGGDAVGEREGKETETEEGKEEGEEVGVTVVEGEGGVTENRTHTSSTLAAGAGTSSAQTSLNFPPVCAIPLISAPPPTHLTFPPPPTHMHTHTAHTSHHIRCTCRFVF